MPPVRRARTSPARRAWQILFGLFTRTQPRRTKILAAHRLTPNDARALFTIDVEAGRTMHSLSDEWGCDPSYATWVIDRLEKLRLAERRTFPGDRRVKMVLLTRRGERLREVLRREFHEPPPEIAKLRRRDVEDLRRVLERIFPDQSEAPVRRRRAASR